MENVSKLETKRSTFENQTRGSWDALRHWIRFPTKVYISTSSSYHDTLQQGLLEIEEADYRGIQTRAIHMLCFSLINEVHQYLPSIVSKPML